VFTTSSILIGQAQKAGRELNKGQLLDLQVSWLQKSAYLSIKPAAKPNLVKLIFGVEDHKGFFVRGGENI